MKVPDLQYQRGPSDDGDFPAEAGRGAAGESTGRPLRILWVKMGGLWPVNTGGRLRSYHLIQELSRKHQISVITTYDPQESADRLEQHLPYCKRIITIAHTSTKRNSVRFLLVLLRSWLTRFPVDLYKSRLPVVGREVSRTLASGEFDLCVADFLFAVPNVPMEGPTPVVFFSHNVEYMIWRRLGQNDNNFLRKAVLAVEWRKMRRYESRACDKAGLTIAVSEQDRQLLGQDAAIDNIRAIPTGVDLDYFKASGDINQHASGLVFTGSMDWQPNEDAMLYFIQTILPLVRQENPQVTLTIVGRNPRPKVLESAARAGVEVTGTVADVRPYIERAAVYIVPLRIGGGTRLKIFEALAMGKAVVSTTIGAEGLPLAEGVHIRRADDPDEFAKQVITLLGDPARRQAMGRAGRELMEQQFGWRTVAHEFERHCREMVQA